MNRILLDPAILDRIRADASAERWRRALHAGGWFAEPPGPERAAFRVIREELAALERAEADIARSLSPIPWMMGGVPKAVGRLFLVTFLVLVVVAELTIGLGVIVGALLTPVVLSPLAFVGLGVAAIQERNRRIFLAESERARAAHQQGLVAAVAAVGHRTVVASVPGGVVVSAPHLTWVTHRLRDLRLARRPVEPPERGALVADLEAIRERMERALAADPVEPGGLECDITGFHERFRALGTPSDPSGEGRTLAAALTG